MITESSETEISSEEFEAVETELKVLPGGVKEKVTPEFQYIFSPASINNSGADKYLQRRLFGKVYKVINRKKTQEAQEKSTFGHIVKRDEEGN